MNQELWVSLAFFEVGRWVRGEQGTKPQGLCPQGPRAWLLAMPQGTNNQVSKGGLRVLGGRHEGQQTGWWSRNGRQRGW